MGHKEFEALVAILQEQLKSDRESVITGAWTITFSRDFNAFMFEKCELGGYCEERPSVIALDGKVLDKGGPLLGEPV